MSLGATDAWPGAARRRRQLAGLLRYFPLPYRAEGAIRSNRLGEPPRPHLPLTLRALRTQLSLADVIRGFRLHPFLHVCPLSVWEARALWFKPTHDSGAWTVEPHACALSRRVHTCKWREYQHVPNQTNTEILGVNLPSKLRIVPGLWCLIAVIVIIMFHHV